MGVSAKPNSVTHASAYPVHKCLGGLINLFELAPFCPVLLLVARQNGANLNKSETRTNARIREG